MYCAYYIYWYGVVTMVEQDQKEQSLKRKLLWVFIFILVAAASVWAVISRSDDFTLVKFAGYIAGSSPFYMTAAFVSVAAYVFFEGCALLHLLSCFGYKQSLRSGIVYSSADIYVSSITPSASGGQPAAAYFMYRSGVPVAVSTVILFLNISVYAVSILSFTLFGLIVRPHIFMGFDNFYKLLMLIGFIAQSALVAFFIIVMKFERLVEWVCSLIISVLSKIRIIKNRKAVEDKVEKSIEQYRTCAAMLGRKKGIMPKLLLFNFLQRASIIAVPMFTYLATHDAGISEAFDVWLTQAYVVLGANSIPIPGAVGVTDALMLNGFRNITDNLTEFELLGRGVSFYCCVLICGIIMLTSYICVKRRMNKPIPNTPEEI